MGAEFRFFFKKYEPFKLKDDQKIVKKRPLRWSKIKNLKFCPCVKFYFTNVHLLVKFHLHRCIIDMGIFFSCNFLNFFQYLIFP